MPPPIRAPFRLQQRRVTCFPLGLTCGPLRLLLGAAARSATPAEGDAGTSASAAAVARPCETANEAITNSPTTHCRTIRLRPKVAAILTALGATDCNASVNFHTFTGMLAKSSLRLLLNQAAAMSPVWLDPELAERWTG